MRCAAGRLGHIDHIVGRLAFFAAIVVVCGGLLHADTVRAVSTSIDAAVYDGKPASFKLMSPASGTIVNTPSVTVVLNSHNIGQITILIDGVPSQTVPIDAASPTTTITVALPEGRHTISFEAIDPYQSTTLLAELVVTYSPQAPDSVKQPATIGGVVQQTVKDANSRAQDSYEYLNQQTSEAAKTTPFRTLSGVVYQWLLAVDIAQPSRSSEAIDRMFLRFLLIVVGTILLILAGPLVGFYHWVRYRLLRWNIHAMPQLVHRHARFVLRLLGLILIAIPFVLIG